MRARAARGGCGAQVPSFRRWVGLAARSGRSRRRGPAVSVVSSRVKWVYLHDPDDHDGVITHLEPSWNAKSSGP